ncbi:MAG: HEAT repeat domain-containing protein, partial [Planctomycetota bacterium]|nr:HEAT repeat domain-containing protein [Planctomycetota bacterium]
IVRTAAFHALSGDLDQAQLAAVTLVRAAGDADESVRESAVAVLEKLGPPNAEDVDQLAGLLSGTHDDTAYWAATLIGRCGAVGCAASQALNQALAHPSTGVQQQAAWALGQLGPSARCALPALNEATTSDDPRLARLAQQAAEKIES